MCCAVLSPYNPKDYSPPGSSVQGIFQTRILKQVAISYSKGSPPPGDQTCVSFVCYIGWRILCHWATREAPLEFYVCVCVCISRSVVSNSLRPYRLWLTRLLCPGDSPGKNTGVDSHSLLQGIFPTQGSNLGLLPCRQILYHLSHQGNP